MEEVNNRIGTEVTASIRKKLFLIFFIDYLFLRNWMHDLHIFYNFNYKGIKWNVLDVLGVIFGKKTPNTSRKIFGNFV